MQLANSPAREAHVDAGDFLRDLEIGLGDLSRPAAVLNAAWSIVEGSPEHRHVADGSRRRRESVALAGLSLVLISPCGGRSGLPNVCAFAAMLAVTAVPASAAVSRLRRDIGCMKRLL